jgi:NAD+ synthase/NAD+ synthase (glutamine-hydrolysing)
MRVALGQINATVGDLSGNTARMVDFAHRAEANGAGMIVFPELSITGYPPRDLVEKPSFRARSEAALLELAKQTERLEIQIVAGYVGSSHSETGKSSTNNAALVRRGQVVFRQTKALLPTYDVFDEDRYFVPAAKQTVFPMDGRNLAIAICEDAWNDKQFWKHRLYSRDPVAELMALGGNLLVNINASPFHMGKRELRREMLAAQARRHAVPVVWVNQVGGNDQLVFDGSSFVMDQTGRVIAEGASFEEDLIFADLEAGTGDRHATLPDECEAVYQALVLGTRDYVRKCGFARVLIGLSGGIDSSLTAAVAVEALGAENVTGVSMPGPFSSEGSVTDAREMAASLGIRFESAPITPAYEVLQRDMEALVGRHGIMEENLQSRLRGVTMMALSNQSGAMVLTTGNKSEIAVGYCTLYGDMCGGLAVISDVPKTMVYDLSRVANRRLNGAIPESVFEKAPSAELRADQKDSDSLPDYNLLDGILRLYVEEYRTPREIAGELGIDYDLVASIALKVDRNEYKRQQAAPGLKVTSKAFGIGRRFPIAQKYTD